MKEAAEKKVEALILEVGVRKEGRVKRMTVVGYDQRIKRMDARVSNCERWRNGREFGRGPYRLCTLPSSTQVVNI